MARIEGRSSDAVRGPAATIEGEAGSRGGSDRIKRAAKARLKTRAAEKNASRSNAGCRDRPRRHHLPQQAMRRRYLRKPEPASMAAELGLLDPDWDA